MTTTNKTFNALFAGICVVAGCGGALPDIGNHGNPVDQPQANESWFKLIETANSNVFWARSEIPGDSYAYDRVEMSPAPLHPITETTIEFFSPNHHTEFGVLAVDPQISAQETVAAIQKFEGGQASFDFWINNSTLLGNMVTYPFPNADIPFMDVPLDYKLPVVPFGPVVDPSAGVHAARMYDHGACSREVDLQTMLGKVKSDFTKSLSDTMDNLKKQWYGDLIGKTTFVGRAESFLTHKEGTPNDQGGGILFGVSALVEIKDVPDEDLNFFYALPISLDNGVVQLGQQLVYGDTSGLIGVQNTIYKTVADSVTANINTTNNGIRLAQSLPISFCDPAAPDFKKINTPLMGGMQLGAVALGLSQADQDTMANVIADDKNWICVPNVVNNQPQPNDGTARFVLRAHRLNVYPDKIEPVWFDSPDPTSTAYVAWVAAHAPAAPAGAADQLCNWKLPAAGAKLPPFYPRLFSSVDMSGSL
jgi:hypothetical protein